MKLLFQRLSPLLLLIFFLDACKKETGGNYVRATINGAEWKSDLVLVETNNSVSGIVPSKISGIKGTETLNLRTGNPNPGTYPFRLNQINPVVLMSFTGELFESSHRLRWSTGTETDVSLFNIESSTDGINWSNLTTKTPTGSNSNYEVIPTTDVAAGPSYYYRLKITNTNGTFNYSSIVVITGNYVGSYRPGSDIERRGYDGSLEITGHDQGSRTITGRFHFKVKTPAGQVYNITNGEFRASY